MIVAGNYILNLKISDVEVPLEPQKIQEITITQDIDRFLPVLRFRVSDPTNSLAHVVPFDRRMNTMSIEVARGARYENLNEFVFLVKRRFCDDESTYEVEGVLETEDLFGASKCRSLKGNVKTNLEDLAKNEIGVSKTEVGASLNYEKTIIQPNWSNAKLLKYLKNNLSGALGEGGYVCFIKNVRGEKIFVFKSFDELSMSTIKYKFIVGPGVFPDYYPVSKYKIFDNSPLIIDYLRKGQLYTYFDYDTGEYTSDSVSLEEVTSLTQYLLVNKDELPHGGSVALLRRNNDFTSDYKGKVKNSYYAGMRDLISMWISTHGLENISPGEVVQVVFGEMFSRGRLFLYQHSGRWLVKRVVHILGQTFLTNLLLIRSGVDTDEPNSLVEAVRRRRG